MAVRGSEHSTPAPDPGAGVQPGAAPSLPMGTVVRFWWPLAASWLLMSAEMPLVTAFVARMPEATYQLAAFGVALSLALAVESPVISLLTAANALARDRASLRLLRRFMLGLNAAATAALLLLTLTSLFDLVIVRLMGTPAEIAVYVRPALLALTPWPAAIGYRRFCQGLMIQHGHTRQVSYGTAMRLVTSLAALIAGSAWGRLAGATMGGLALAASVLAEAVCAHYLSRPAARAIEAMDASTADTALSLRSLVQFYWPLTVTSTIMLSTTPILNWGMARSPHPISSLAVWPVVNGQLFVLRSFGYSLQEVVIALLHRPGAPQKLRTFSIALGAGSLALILAVALTPLGPWWQRRVAGLSADLAAFAVPALQLAVLLPLFAVVQSWLRGIVVYGQATGAIAQATVVNLAVLAATFLAGASLSELPGASLAAIALTASQGVESAWLWRSARSTDGRCET